MDGRPSLPFDVETVGGADALARRAALLAEGRGYPVVAGATDRLDWLGAELETADATSSCLETARALDVDEWLARRVASDPEYYEEDHGDWPDGVGPTTAFTGPTDIVTGRALAEVAIVLVPTEESWQVPCLLGYGDWNECPAPPEHSAVFRRWERHFGATVVTMTQDTVELAVARPPTAREAAIELAREQYVYCPDIVQQGTETIEGLAASLLDAPVWFFWWD